MSITLSWMGDSLWSDAPNDNPVLRALRRKQCVGTVRKTKRGTYWAVHFYMGNVRTALPTEQEAKDLMMVLARSHYGMA
jgi:hypothetical protein